MMSKEELMKLKEDVAEIQEKLRMLTDEELEQVFGGYDIFVATCNTEHNVTRIGD